MSKKTYDAGSDGSPVPSAAPSPGSGPAGPGAAELADLLRTVLRSLSTGTPPPPPAPTPLPLPQKAQAAVAEFAAISADLRVATFDS